MNRRERSEYKSRIKKRKYCSDNRRLIELLKPAGPEMHDGET